MRENKFTPGPWYATADPDRATWRVSQQPEGGTFWIAEAVDGLMNDETEPNARLIAAAPDLLAALEALSSNPYLHLGDLVYAVREKEGEGWDGPAVTAWSEAVMAAKAAIAKARGE